MKGLRAVLAVAALSLAGVIALVLWPAGRVELAPEPGRQGSAGAKPAPHFHPSEPGGPAAQLLPRAPPPPGAPVPAAPRPAPDEEGMGSSAPPVGHAARPAPAALPPGAGSLSPDGGARYGITRDGIRAAVRAGVPEIKDCYEQWLRLQPTLGGKLRVTFTIDTDDGVEGKVSKVSLGDAGIGHAAMEGCVLQVFQDLRFEPPLNGSVDVAYPIILANSGPDGG